MTKEKQLHIRVSEEEKEQIEKNANKMGFKQISEYVRFLGLLDPTCNINISIGLGEINDKKMDN